MRFIELIIRGKSVHRALSEVPTAFLQHNRSKLFVPTVALQRLPFSTRPTAKDHKSLPKKATKSVFGCMVNSSCTKLFNSTDALKKHIELRHGDHVEKCTIKCYKCGIPFLDDLRKHQYQLKCVRCGYSSVSQMKTDLTNQLRLKNRHGDVLEEEPEVFLHSLKDEHNPMIPLSPVLRGAVNNEAYIDVPSCHEHITSVEDEKDFALLHFTVGPMVIPPHSGREMVVKLGTELNIKDSFYHKISSDFITKIRDWEAPQVERVVGQYYPTSLVTYLGVKKIEVFLLVDPTLGGSPPLQAHIDFIRHGEMHGEAQNVVTLKGSLYYGTNLGDTRRRYGIDHEFTWLSSSMTTFAAPKGAKVPNLLLVASLQVENGQTLLRLVPYERCHCTE